mmetsp:Transcript_6721/g.25180  ORF Transcript_6721/g.25180 Transcript_6721/m.25180 type:complete len:116 (+) Transcript_6721:565-912(+)
MKNTSYDASSSHFHRSRPLTDSAHPMKRQRFNRNHSHRSDSSHASKYFIESMIIDPFTNERLTPNVATSKPANDLPDSQHTRNPLGHGKHTSDEVAESDTLHTSQPEAHTMVDTE